MVSCVTKAYCKSQACQQEVALADVLKKPILNLLLNQFPGHQKELWQCHLHHWFTSTVNAGSNTEYLNKVLTTILSKVQ